jgi:hypothetical protein
MARIYALLFFAGLIMAIIALISCLSAEDGEVRGLPRIVWVLIILFFPLLGSIAYYFAGRPVRAATSGQSWRPGTGSPKATRPKRVLAPDDDPDFLRKLDQQSKQEDEELLRRWEEDLRKREGEIRKREDTPPGEG